MHRSPPDIYGRTAKCQAWRRWGTKSLQPSGLTAARDLVAKAAFLGGRRRPHRLETGSHCGPGSLSRGHLRGFALLTTFLLTLKPPLHAPRQRGAILGTAAPQIHGCLQRLGWVPAMCLGGEPMRWSAAQNRQRCRQLGGGARRFGLLASFFRSLLPEVPHFLNHCLRTFATCQL